MVTALKEKDGLRSAFEAHSDILEGIGCVVSVWGAISHLLRELLSRILGCDPLKADVVLNGFSGEDRRLHFLIDLLDAQPQDEEIVAFKAALRNLKKLTPERNLIVHGAPVHGGKQGQRPRSEYFVNFKKTDDSERYVGARSLLDRHISKLRRRGGELFDLLYPDPDA